MEHNINRVGNDEPFQYFWFEMLEDEISCLFKSMKLVVSWEQNNVQSIETKRMHLMILFKCLYPVKRNLIAMIRNMIKHGKSCQDLAMLHGRKTSRYVRTCMIFAWLSRNKILHVMARCIKFRFTGYSWSMSIKDNNWSQWETKGIIIVL